MEDLNSSVIYIIYLSFYEQYQPITLHTVVSKLLQRLRFI